MTWLFVFGVRILTLASYKRPMEANLDVAASLQVLPGSATNAPRGGLWQFTDADAANYSKRYYRSVSP